MGGRNLSNDQGNADKGLVKLVFVVNVGAAGAVTMEQWNPSGANPRTYSAASTALTPQGGFRGVQGVSRTGTGAWTVKLQNSYQRIVSWNAFSQIAGGLAAAPNSAINLTGTNVNTQVNWAGNNTGPQINIQFLSAASTAADPASGEQIVCCIELQDSTAS
jgi:hypothetical protein